MGWKQSKYPSPDAWIMKMWFKGTVTIVKEKWNKKSCGLTNGPSSIDFDFQTWKCHMFSLICELHL